MMPIGARAVAEAAIPDRPISFEVCSDDFRKMAQQAARSRNGVRR
jgi:hypothetical protein